MSPGDAESRPVAGAAIEKDSAAAGLKSIPSMPRVAPIVVDGEPARVVLDVNRPVDLINIGRAQLDIFAAGFTAGYLEGIDRGRQDADDEAVQLFQEATRVVHVMAGIDPYADRQRRATGGGR